MLGQARTLRGRLHLHAAPQRHKGREKPDSDVTSVCQSVTSEKPGCTLLRSSVFTPVFTPVFTHTFRHQQRPSSHQQQEFFAPVGDTTSNTLDLVPAGGNTNKNFNAIWLPRWCKKLKTAKLSTWSRPKLTLSHHHQTNRTGLQRPERIEVPDKVERQVAVGVLRARLPLLQQG